MSDQAGQAGEPGGAVPAAPVKERAPTLYAIIAVKLLKAALFIALAITIYTLSDNDLPAEYRSLLEHLRVNPERRFWVNLAEKVANLTEPKMRWAAAGTLAFSLFTLVEGIGLMFRAWWAGWISIGESAFFIPIEVYELMRPRRFASTVSVVVILAINVVIVWYLYTNRARLFRKHFSPTPP